jgi:hypothetical protein
MSYDNDDDLGLNISVPWFENTEPKAFIPPQQRTLSPSAQENSALSFKERKMAKQQRQDEKRSGNNKSESKNFKI